MGLTQEAAAFKLGVSVSTFRGWESGGAMPRVGYRPRLAKLLDVTLADVDAYLDRNGVVTPNGHSVPTWLGHLASLEQGAAEIRAFEPVVINGLVQTVDYATAVERVGFDDDEAAKRVELRMARQDVLRCSPDPLRLWVVLDESTLLRVAGDESVMADQLDHLVEVAGLPNVTLQVLRLGSDAFLVAFGAFKLFVASESAEPYMACTEDGVGANYLDRPYDIERHVALFESLVEAALSPSESVDLVRNIAKERYR